MIKSFDLAWIVVSDFQKARKFFTETLGLKEGAVASEYGWAEMQGHDGAATLGIAQQSEHSEIAAGKNAIVTLTVEDLEATVAEFKKKNVNLVGEIIEIPGHVKMQTFTDPDGNVFQIVQKLDHES